MSEKPDAIRRSFDAIAEAYARQFSDELERKPYDRDLLPRILNVGFWQHS